MERRIIRVLDSDTINKIAAGEVIDRPASVVKELAENSIDAGATAVTIEVSASGKKRIRVTDNGVGIEAKQVPTAFLRHATSKIKSADDLENVASLGFRGEALSSIAAVARVELITRTNDSISGLRYIIEDGVEKECEEVGAPAGTTIIVHELFSHVPARKKFMGSDQAEAAAIADTAEKLAISHPEVSIRLIINGRLRFMTSGSGKLSDVIYSIMGREIASQLLAVSNKAEGAEISGYIGKPSASRGNRSMQLFWVNGRSIRSHILTQALEEAFYGHLMQHKYPVAFLDIKVVPESLDVNVHPAKLEVRFADEAAVRECIISAVKRALSENELITYATYGKADSVKKEEPKRPFETASYREPFEMRVPHDNKELPDITAFDDTAINEAGVGAEPVFEPEEETVLCEAEEADYPEKASVKGSTITKENLIYAADTQQEQLFGERLLSAENRQAFKLLGIAFDTYLLVQTGDDFMMIDQHAAHEKILFEQYMEEIKKGKQTSQQCAPPVILSVSAAEEAVLLNNMTHFQKMGFEIEAFGGRDYALYAVPDNMPSLARSDIFLELLNELAADGTSASRLVHDRVAVMACKAAVKGFDRLSVLEAETLIDRLLSLKDPYTCPHGRPTAILMTRDEIEKKFKRIVT